MATTASPTNQPRTTAAVAKGTSRRPSAATLLHRLAAPAPGSAIQVALPSFTWFSRALVAASLILLATLAWALANLAGQTLLMLEGVRSKRAQDQHAATALPAGPELLDPAIRHQALTGHPLAAGRLHARYAMALYEAGRIQESLAAFREAELSAVSGLTPETILAWCQALAADQDWVAARDRLLAQDLTTWPAPAKEQAVALLATAWDRCAHLPLQVADY